MTDPSRPSPNPGGIWAVSPFTSSSNLAGLGFLTFGVVSSGPVGLSGRGLVALVMLALADVCWVGWLGERAGWLGSWPSPAALGGMAVFGGILAGIVPLGMVFPAVATMGAILSRPAREAPWVGIAGALAVSLGLAIGTHGEAVGFGAAAAIMGGCLVGMMRRRALERATNAANVELAQARADAEAARAELLASRNHLARELHDVLAHSLAGLSVQIGALEVLMADGPTQPPAVTAQVEQIKKLVRGGLDEAREAVAALREDLPPLDDRLKRLLTERNARLEVTGPPLRLSPEVSMALYRVAQEALTNALKHAPGSPVAVSLNHSGQTVTLSISNPAPTGPGPTALSSTGGGYGLQGIRERVLLIGGSVEAGPDDRGGWRVEARVPV